MAFEYESVAHKFSPGTKVEKLIREHNHLNMSDDVVTLLMEEFRKINGTTPPVMGEVVQIPVLLPFCAKHVRTKARLGKA